MLRRFLPFAFILLPFGLLGCGREDPVAAGLPRLETLWSSPLASYGYISLQGHLLVAGPKVKAFDVREHRLAFSLDSNIDRGRTSVTMMGEHLVVVTSAPDLKMLVVDRAGQVVNTILFPDPSAVALRQQGPYVVGSTLYVTNGKTVYAYDTETLLSSAPQPRWRRTFPGLYIISMIVDESGQAFVGTADNRIVALDPDGQQRWEVRTAPDDGTFQAAYVMGLSGDTLITQAGVSGLQAYDKDTGKAAWANFPSVNVCAGRESGAAFRMEIAGGKVFLGHWGGGCISAWDARTGQLAWTFEAPNRVTFDTQPKYVNGVVYATNSRLWAVDAETGQALAVSAENTGDNTGTPVHYDPVENQVLVWGADLVAFRPLR